MSTIGGSSVPLVSDDSKISPNIDKNHIVIDDKLTITQFSNNHGILYCDKINSHGFAMYANACGDTCYQVQLYDLFTQEPILFLKCGDIFSSLVFIAATIRKSELILIFLSYEWMSVKKGKILKFPFLYASN